MPQLDGAEDDADYENLSVTSAKYLDPNPSFRKIFYRAVDSVMVRTGDWGGFGGKFLFYGVTLKSEFCSNSPWFTLRQMEETMAEEAELAGDLCSSNLVLLNLAGTPGIVSELYIFHFRLGINLIVCTLFYDTKLQQIFIPRPLITTDLLVPMVD